MACVNNISYNTFPRQASFLGERVDVCFHHDTAHTLQGTVVRDDAEEPFEMIIALDDGRYVLSTECQHRLSYNYQTPVVE